MTIKMDFAKDWDVTPKANSYLPPKHWTAYNKPITIGVNEPQNGIQFIGDFSQDLMIEIIKFVPTRKYDRKRISVLLKSKGTCQLCKRPIKSLSDFNLDHILPRSKGGGDSTNNLQATHQKCNSIRGSKPIQECYPEMFTGFMKAEKKKKSSHSSAVAKNMDMNKLPILDIDEMSKDYCVELYNEIARHGMNRLSYKLFREYFDKYAAVRASGLKTIS